MTKEQKIRKVFYYKNYYIDFFNTLKPEVQRKFNWTLQLIQDLEVVPSKFLKHLSGTSGLYEIRVEYSSNTYRVFCFFDDRKLVILLNGFQKKTQKTPNKEIINAEKLKKQYFNEK